MLAARQARPGVDRTVVLWQPSDQRLPRRFPRLFLEELRQGRFPEELRRFLPVPGGAEKKEHEKKDKKKEKKRKQKTAEAGDRETIPDRNPDEPPEDPEGPPKGGLEPGSCGVECVVTTATQQQHPAAQTAVQQAHRQANTLAPRAGGCMLSNRGGEVRFLKSASVLGFAEPPVTPRPPRFRAPEPLRKPP